MRVLTAVSSAIFYAFLSVLGAPSDAVAGPITFSCNGDTTAPFTGLECNGLSYAVTFDGQFGPQQRYSLWIKTSTAYTGNSTDAINAVALSGLKSTFTGLNPSLLMAPAGSTQNATPGGSAFFLFTTTELAGKGCKAIGTAGTNSLCADWIGTGYGVSVLPEHEYRWQFGFDATGPYDPTAHIKYHFVQTTGPNAGKKVGSLGSWGIGVQVLQVPEVSSLGSLLVGLCFVGLLTRRL